jgi:hypothetical protein
LFFQPFYSDILFHSWQCATIDLSKFTGTDNVPRRSNLSFEDFVKEYGLPNKPVIITDLVPKWPAFKEWTREGLIEKYGGASKKRPTPQIFSSLGFASPITITVTVGIEICFQAEFYCVFVGDSKHLFLFSPLPFISSF